MEILLIEDNPADVMIFNKALKEVGSSSKVTIFDDGNNAMDYLINLSKSSVKSGPILIVLDLKLPGKDGLMLLEFLKDDDFLKRIPVVILTDSESINDIKKAYDLHANCFIIKPMETEKFMKYVEYIDNFWSNTVMVPKY